MSSGRSISGGLFQPRIGKVEIEEPSCSQVAVAISAGVYADFRASFAHTAIEPAGPAPPSLRVANRRSAQRGVTPITDDSLPIAYFESNDGEKPSGFGGVYV